MCLMIYNWSISLPDIQILYRSTIELNQHLQRPWINLSRNCTHLKWGNALHCRTSARPLRLLLPTHFSEGTERGSHNMLSHTKGSAAISDHWKEKRPQRGRQQSRTGQESPLAVELRINEKSKIATFQTAPIIMTQLYVGNLSEEGDEKSIRSLFGKYGTVREVLMKNGYAFVEMESPLQAEHVMRVLNGETF